MNPIRIIHYCWFGQKKIPEKLSKCMDSWASQMPDYEIKRWDETVFDVNSTAWTKEAYSAKKYAFVSDYVRLVALYEYGGIYLDTDVMLTKSLTPLQEQHHNYMGFENDNVLTSAIMCFEPHNSLVKEFLNYYNDRDFSYKIVKSNEANVIMMTHILVRHGLLANNEEQDIYVNKQNRLHIFPRTYFCPLDFYHNKDFSINTHAIHFFDASWLDDDTKKRIVRERTTPYKLKMLFLKYLKLIKDTIIR